MTPFDEIGNIVLWERYGIAMKYKGKQNIEMVSVCLINPLGSVFNLYPRSNLILTFQMNVFVLW